MAWSGSVLEDLCRTILKDSLTLGKVPSEGESAAYFPAFKAAIKAKYDRYMRVSNEMTRHIRSTRLGPHIEVAARHARRIQEMIQTPAMQTALDILNMPSVRHHLAAIQHAVAVLDESVTNRLGAIQQAAAVLDESVTNRLRAIKTHHRTLESLGEIFRNLPQFDLWEEFQRAVDAAVSEKKETDYGFISPYWPVGHLIELARLPERDRNVVISRRLLSITQEQMFIDEILDTLSGSRLLKKRGKIAEEGLENHRLRRYHSAISTLLPQVEGILADLVALSGRVKLSRGKLYELDTHGRYKQDKKGKRIEVKGVRRLVQLSGYSKGHPLELTAHVLTNEIFRDRNLILHGKRVNFGKPKESTRVVLTLYILARELEGIESKARSKTIEDNG